jgi:hypothetical protein
MASGAWDRICCRISGEKARAHNLAPTVHLTRGRFWHFRRPIIQSERPNANLGTEGSHMNQQIHDIRVKVQLHLYKTEEGELRVDCVSVQGSNSTSGKYLRS